MRLVCPNCGAQYEVDDRVIPESGRDVQCSACGHAWYQMPQGQSEAAQDDAALEPAEEPSIAAPEQEPAEESGEPEGGAAEPVTEEPESLQDEPRRAAIDEGVRTILQEEAQTEMARRASEQVETQPDLGLETGPSPEEERRRVARERIARMRGLEGEELPESEAEVEPRAEPAPQEAGQQVPRRDLFPDIEEINSTLDGHGAAGEAANPAREAEQSRGFGRGFFLIIFLAALLLALYLVAPRLSETVPALEPALAAFVDAVNAGRAWLDTAIQGIIAKIEALSAGQS